MSAAGSDVTNSRTRNLRNSSNDEGRENTAIVLRSTLGAIPFVVPALNELVNELIPDQRFERIRVFLESLDERLSTLEDSAIQHFLQSDAKIALFEDGARLSASAKQRSGGSRIARIVEQGIRGSDQDAIESSRILALLERIDDDQVIVLMRFTQKYGRDADFLEKNRSVLEHKPAHMQSTREEIDASLNWDLMRQQLIDLGLLRHKFKTIKKGQLPEFDARTGMPKTLGIDITPLGRLLLRRLEIIEDR